MNRKHFLFPIAGALCGVAVVFYCAYTRSYDGVGLVILLVFFSYFLNLKLGSRSGAVVLSSSYSQGASPLREVVKAVACLVAGAVGVAIGLKIPDIQLGVATALTALVIALVAFMLFVLRALNARNSG